MTETVQGGPTKGAIATATKPETAQVERDPKTGINRDMPCKPDEVAGMRDFGDRFCR